MKKFSFKLQSLMDWRKAQYEQAELKYAQAIRLQKNAKLTHEATEGALQSFQEAQKTLRQTPQQALDCQQNVIFFQKLAADCDLAAEAFDQAKKMTEVILKEMLEKKIALQGVEKLYQKKAKRYTFEAMRREEKEIEDIVLHKFS